ncbi:hypothetical protein SGL43_06943 [Streptomyces globisporus]|uniref:Uncharacterized protein n=1 Tax=Streptomyces globisporus TaxID=1908 RepID=A0ABM9H891_STRGL|nr:hypothetical protein SGL43_06943 [Streptomyces globisporus]
MYAEYEVPLYAAPPLLLSRVDARPEGSGPGPKHSETVSDHVVRCRPGGRVVQRLLVNGRARLCGIPSGQRDFRIFGTRQLPRVAHQPRSP